MLVILVWIETETYNYDAAGDRKQLYQTATAWQDFCDSQGVETWAVFGTLLGAVREMGLISHDDDLDFGIKEAEWRTITTQVLENAHFSVDVFWPNSLFHLTYRVKDVCVTFDVFVFVPEGPRCWKLCGRAGEYWSDYTISDSQLVGKEVVPFGPSRTIYVPSDSEATLEAYYGSDWRTPRKWIGHSVVAFRNSYGYGILIGSFLLILCVPSFFHKLRLKGRKQSRAPSKKLVQRQTERAS
jgi:hypothetical protein